MPDFTAEILISISKPTLKRCKIKKRKLREMNIKGKEDKPDNQ